jgi:hypothetical protein
MLYNLKPKIFFVKFFLPPTNFHAKISREILKKHEKQKNECQSSQRQKKNYDIDTKKQRLVLGSGK